MGLPGGDRVEQPLAPACPRDRHRSLSAREPRHPPDRRAMPRSVNFTAGPGRSIMPSCSSLQPVTPCCPARTGRTAVRPAGKSSPSSCGQPRLAADMATGWTPCCSKNSRSSVRTGDCRHVGPDPRRRTGSSPLADDRGGDLRRRPVGPYIATARWELGGSPARRRRPDSRIAAPHAASRRPRSVLVLLVTSRPPVSRRCR